MPIERATGAHRKAASALGANGVPRHSHAETVFVSSRGRTVPGLPQPRLLPLRPVQRYARPRRRFPGQISGIILHGERRSCHRPSSRVLPPRPPASCISAARGRRCSTGLCQANGRHACCCASRIPTASARPTAAVDAILDGLTWLGLDWDGEPSRNMPASSVTAKWRQLLLAQGHAYRCYCTPRGAGRDARQGRSREAAHPL